MCDHQRSPYIESDSGQMSDSSVNSGNNNLFVAILVLYNPRIIRFARQGMCYYESERCERSASPNCVNCLFMWSANQICEALYAQGTEDCKRNGEEKTCFSLGRSADSVL